MNCPFHNLSSISKKQIVAVSGLLLILYVIAHLLGNLLIYFGPDAFNGYAGFLAGLRPGLSVVELLLLMVFLTHSFFTYLVVLENIQSRGGRYRMYQPVGKRSWATRLMPYTGTILLVFVIWHVFDFTLSDHHGPRSVIEGENLGLYGMVFNSFLVPWHSGFYIVAMACLGLHLSHAIQSVFQTFGFNHIKYTPIINRGSNALGWLVALGFSSIPVWVLITGYRG